MVTRLTSKLSSRFAAAIIAMLALGGQAAEAEPEALLTQLDEYPHAVQVAASDSTVADYEVPLGALKKVRGVWGFKDSQRHSGRLVRYTWQIVDGFSSREIMEELQGQVAANAESVLLFECDGRACGQAAQWANRVFRQRVLYGREDLQHYRIYSLGAQADYRLMIYSSARTADRQYLHVDLLRLESGQAP
jgi:hypothetical protein